MTLLLSVALLALLVLLAASRVARPLRAQPVPVRIPSEQASIAPPSRR